ncbi:MAG: hypothetical protein AB4352_17860, partial [Hormoscilla sp.]
ETLPTFILTSHILHLYGRPVNFSAIPIYSTPQCPIASNRLPVGAARSHRIQMPTFRLVYHILLHC